MANLLRDHLLDGLKDLPGTRDFFIHVLVTAPRKHQGLFPFARPRPRAYLQDILILLSEKPASAAPRVLTTAVEASVYNIPSTSCAILYISKVDSTGQATTPSPTPALVRALLSFYANPATRPVSADHLWIHLFARAQGQYLFPNSADFAGKRPLTDVKLCAWWKRVLSNAVAEVKDATTKLYYVLPGYSQEEAEQAIARAATTSAAAASAPTWTYGHPYSQTEIPLPCPRPAATSGAGPAHNLGHYIPTFEDDPKSRFMDEIGCDEDVIRSPPKKRARTTTQSGEDEKDKDKEERVAAQLTRVSPDEFWERMSFRQECVAGAVTGFFIAAVSCKMPVSAVSPLAPSPGQVSAQLNKRVLNTLMTGLEFSTVERAVKATESLESSIKGLCDGIVPLLAAPRSMKPKSRVGSNDRPRTPEPEPAKLLAPPPPSTPPRRGAASYVPDVSPNPFPEPVTSLETYNAHIYGTISVANAVVAKSREPVAQPEVRVLAVRKKKKAGA
ncbi:hypothetical protein MKEN_00893900 [Mycena kentingensis (nom. inval.)]|nr:hypothetical protein MKEN_00893900 [Mycena kentingensis (nom. inval.)]